jgi:hypothetical protein
MRYILITILCILSFSSGAEPFAVVKSVKGPVTFSHIGDSTARDLKTSAILPSKVQIQSDPNGEAVLRLFLGEATLEIHPLSTLECKREKVEEKVRPVIRLIMGELLLDLASRDSDVLSVQSENTSISPRSARWLMTVDSGGKTVLIVIRGELIVYNRPKDATASVLAGKICQSDEDGLKITDAQESDLLLLRQNYLEIDFIHPETQETKTLEIEYESNF